MTKRSPPYIASQHVGDLLARVRRIEILDEQVGVLDNTTAGTPIKDTPSVAGFAYDPEGLVDKWSEANLVAWRGALRTLLDLDIKAIQVITKKKFVWGGGGSPPKPDEDDEDDDDV